MALTHSDVQNVRTEGMGAALAATAQNVAMAYGGTAPDSSERLIAEDILDAWICEAAQEVRETLSRQLQDCPHLPRKLAVKIAEDVEPVAVPILLKSEVFTDEDLCALVMQGSPFHQLTVARRAFVPHAVSEALVETEREDVVTTLVNNAGAKLSEPALHRIIDCFPNQQPIHVGLVERTVLPVSVGDRLLTVVSEQLQGFLIERFALPRTLAGELSGLTAGAANFAQKGAPSCSDAAQKLVEYLHGVHRLTPTVLLRALCDGKIDVFEAGLMRMAHMPLNEVQEKLRMDDMAGQIDLFARAGIPKPLTLAFRAGVDVIINGTPELYDTDDSEEQISIVVDQMARFEEDTDRASIKAILTRLHRKIESAAQQVVDDITSRAIGPATQALAQELRSQPAPKNNIVQLRTATRTAPPISATPAGARIAAGSTH